MDWWLILMVIAATIGGVIASFLGWKKQNPPCPFDWANFAVSVGSAFLAGGIYAVSGATRTDNPTRDCIVAMVFGPGGGALIRGAIGSVAHSRQPPAAPPS